MKLTSINDAEHSAPGHYRAPCPECDRGTTDDALGITVESGGRYVWHCFRCGWAGASGVTTSNPEPRAQATHKAHHEGLSEWAAALWASTREIDGAARAYLEGRACVCPPTDGDLRWHPNLKHFPTSYTGPALVALVTDAITCKPISLHRTWIRADGKKADVKPARMLIKGHRVKGGLIRLWPDEAVTHGLAVGEGIETMLSLAHAYTPVWSCIDASNLAAFPLLNGIESLVIAADGDAPGRQAAGACAARWRRAGRQAAIVDPGNDRDWNNEAVA